MKRTETEAAVHGARRFRGSPFLCAQTNAHAASHRILDSASGEARRLVNTLVASRSKRAPAVDDKAICSFLSTLFAIKVRPGHGGGVRFVFSCFAFFRHNSWVTPPCVFADKY